MEKTTVDTDGENMMWNRWLSYGNFKGGGYKVEETGGYDNIGAA